MSKIRIAVVDDHTLFRRGMATILEQVEDFEVVMDAVNGRDFLDKLAKTPVDVVLLDLQMPELDGIKTTQILQKDYPDLKIIILSMHDEDQFVLHLMEIGASGYLLKDTDSDEVEKAIRKVMEAEHYFSEFVSRVMLRRMTRKGVKENDKEKPKLFNFKTDLSEREVQVLKHICEGLTTTEIGDLVALSPRTVEGHRLRMMEKLGLKNTAGLVAFAIKNQIV
jgi:two-component system, NarL family, response regulator DegU